MFIKYEYANKYNIAELAEFENNFTTEEFEKKKKEMEIYSFTYHYANGEKSEEYIMSDLSEEMRAEIKELFREEYNCNQREKRRKRPYLKCGTKKTDENNIDCQINSEKSNKATRQSPDPVLSVILRREEREIINCAIEQLPLEEKELIREIYYKKVKAVEIAGREGVNKSTISKRLTKAEANLKKHLAEYYTA